MKCARSRQNNAYSIVFGYLRASQDELFTSNDHRIPEGIFYICLEFYEGDYHHHMADGTVYKFDDINLFQISLDGHKSCIMPSFELWIKDDKTSIL